MRITILLFVTGILLLAGCKKDDPLNTNGSLFSNLYYCDSAIADTLFPLPYLPVYPGSWWEYDHAWKPDTLYIYDTITYTSASYSLVDAHNYPSANMSCVYAPLWNGSPIYGYKRWDKGDPPWDKPGFESILRETEGMFRKLVANYGSYCVHIEVVDTTVIVNSVQYDSVIVVGWHAGCTERIDGNWYYAKNIGLVYKGWYEPDGDTIYSYKLRDYFVNN